MARSYRIIPGFDGVILHDSSKSIQRLDGQNNIHKVNSILFPNTRDSDELLSGPSAAPLPDILNLECDDIRNIDCYSADSFCHTEYGPADQDKSSNQDFGIAGSFSEDGVVTGRFSIIADGISNGYAFPQRGAQISVFTSYYCLKQFCYEVIRTKTAISNTGIEFFRENLSSSLNEIFDMDIDNLLTNYGAPGHISDLVWEKHFKRKRKRWYGNTLVVSLITKFGGFIVYAGDGAIFLNKNGKHIEVLRSDESSAIDRFVSYGVSDGTFRSIHVAPQKKGSQLSVTTLTDGVDRTMQNQTHPNTHVIDILENSGPDGVIKYIDNIRKQAENQSPGYEQDNYTVAHISYPGTTITVKRNSIKFRKYTIIFCAVFTAVVSTLYLYKVLIN